MEGMRFQGPTRPQPVEKIRGLVELNGDGGGDCFRRGRYATGTVTPSKRLGALTATTGRGSLLAALNRLKRLA